MVTKISSSRKTKTAPFPLSIPLPRFPIPVPWAWRKRSPTAAKFAASDTRTSTVSSTTVLMHPGVILSWVANLVNFPTYKRWEVRPMLQGAACPAWTLLGPKRWLCV